MRRRSSCRRVRAALWRRADGALALEGDFEVSEHLRRCAACAEQARRLDLLGEWLEALPEPPEERLDVDALTRRIGERIAEQRGARTGRAAAARAGRGVRRALACAAAALVVAAVGARLVLDRRAAETRPDAVADGRAEPAAALRDPGPFVELPEAPRVPAPTVARARLVLEPPPAVEAGSASRLEADRATLRAALLAAEPLLRERAASSHAAADEHGSAAFADAVERACSELTRSGRLLVRLVEDELRHPDPRVARAAARYVGARGDRAAHHALERTFHTVPSARRHDWLVALAESGDHGRDALLEALLDPDTCGPAAAALAAASGERRARLLALALPRAEGRVRAALFDSLLGCGADAVDAVLRLHAASALTLEEALRVLRVNDRSGATLAGSVDGVERDGLAVALLLEHARRTRAPALLPRVGELAREPRFAPAALATLVGWPTVEGAALGLELWVEAPQDAPPSAASLVAAAPDAFEALARRLVEPDAGVAGDGGLGVSSESLGTFLVASGSPGALPALFVLACDASQPVARREFLFDAIAELGRPGDAYALDELRRAFEGFLALPRPEPDARRLAARTLLTVRALGGAEAALDLLGAFSPATLRRARATLDPARPDSVALVQLERALERATRESYGRPDSPSRSTP